MQRLLFIVFYELYRQLLCLFPPRADVLHRVRPSATSTPYPFPSPPAHPYAVLVDLTLPLDSVAVPLMLVIECDHLQLWTENSTLQRRILQDAGTNMLIDPPSSPCHRPPFAIHAVHFLTTPFHRMLFYPAAEVRRYRDIGEEIKIDIMQTRERRRAAKEAYRIEKARLRQKEFEYAEMRAMAMAGAAIPAAKQGGDMMLEELEVERKWFYAAAEQTGDDDFADVLNDLSDEDESDGGGAGGRTARKAAKSSRKVPPRSKKSSRREHVAARRGNTSPTLRSMGRMSFAGTDLSVLGTEHEGSNIGSLADKLFPESHIVSSSDSDDEAVELLHVFPENSDSEAEQRLLGEGPGGGKPRGRRGSVFDDMSRQKVDALSGGFQGGEGQWHGGKLCAIERLVWVTCDVSSAGAAVPLQ